MNKELLKPLIDYTKHRWFFTSTGKLVVGGKSAEQNDNLLKFLKKSKENFIVMHTSSPGSPFSLILSPISELKKADIEETAVFTGCFSREWRAGRRRTTVDIFTLSQLYKTNAMKTGTWGVKGDIKRKTVPLKLVLIRQKNKLRAVPEKTANSEKEIITKVAPGKLDKKYLFPKLQVLTDAPLSQEEVLSALPAGGVKIIK